MIHVEYSAANRLKNKEGQSVLENDALSLNVMMCSVIVISGAINLLSIPHHAVIIKYESKADLKWTRAETVFENNAMRLNRTCRFFSVREHVQREKAPKLLRFPHIRIIFARKTVPCNLIRSGGESGCRVNG